jgi:glutamate dehydrogenase/leucine dehydrogenase
MQNVLHGFLLPQLEGMVTNPQGFGATAVSDMNAALMNNVATQWGSARQQANQALATQNAAGLPSGVGAVINSQLGSSAAGEVAGGMTNIQLANEQAKLQQQQNALSMVPGTVQLLGALPQSASAMLQANQNRFGQQYQMAQQGSQWMNILGGVLGAGTQAGLAALTGGASTAAFPGMSAGGISAAFGGPGQASTIASDLPNSIPLVSGVT